MPKGPTVLSTKVTPGHFETVKHLVPPKREIGADPRFSEGSGKCNEGTFRRAYSFLWKAMDKDVVESRGEYGRLRKANAELAREVAKTSDPRKKAELETQLRDGETKQATLRREVDSLQSLKFRADQRGALLDAKKALVEAHEKEVGTPAAGGPRFHPKESAIKAELMKRKFEKLEETGKINDYLAKRRKTRAEAETREFEALAPGVRDRSGSRKKF